MKFKDIREIFWPLLEPLEERTTSSISSADINLADGDLEKCYELAVKYYEDEDNRRSSVESKSTIFVSAIGFTTAILLSVTKDLVLSTTIDFTSATYVYLILLVIIVIYMARAVWFAIKALERRAYHSLTYKDIINKNNDKEYTTAVVTKLVNFTIKNQNVVNMKVDYMVMAHEYFKRAIVTVVIYSITLAVAFPLTRYIKLGSNDDKIIKIISGTNFGTWLLLGCLIAFCVNIFLLRIEQKEQKPDND
jgi:hypothetical protein